MNEISQLLSGKDPQKIYQKLYSENPQFKSFVDANQGKSAEQIAKENGIDLAQIKSMI